MVLDKKLVRREERKRAKNWSLAIRERAGYKCEWCGATKYLNAHHIIGKRFKPLRFDLDNGVCLCPKCHKFGIGYAAHENPFNIYLWVADKDDGRYERLLSKMLDRPKEITNDQTNNGNKRSTKWIRCYYNNRKRKTTRRYSHDSSHS